MATISVNLIVVEEVKCPLYTKGDMFHFDDKSVLFSNSRPSCFILTRELTQLLFKFISGKRPQADKLYGCGGCTGLIKFKLTEQEFPESPKQGEEQEQKSNSGVSGDLTTLSPTEVFQALNISEKNGTISFLFPAGPGFATFQNGEFIKAQYQKREGLEAIFAMLKETEGSFNFEVELSGEEQEPLGSFMMILMEGMRKQDEEADPS
ncbi:MAG: DUF4388 domain-containing protein [Thermodesulfobacteriota bacterium]